MPFLVVRARREPFALMRDHVHESRGLEVAHGCQRVDKGIDVVTIDGPEVAEAQLFEQDAWREERLDGFLPLADERADRGQRSGQIVDDVADRATHPVVDRVSLYRPEVARNGADV